MKNKVIKEKNEQWLFVDGYNIINSWDKLNRLKEIDLAIARHELIEIMSEYQSYTGTKVIIVFDAHLVKKNIGESQVINGVKVIYTKENETADHYIERTLDGIGKIRQVRVATSDWMEQQVVLGRGGTRVSARELEIEVSNMKKVMNTRRNKERETNELFIGGLDEKNINKLKKWLKP